jgi:hypothetical protein
MNGIVLSTVLFNFKSFMDNFDRVSQQGYVPTVDDVLRARVTTTGVSETEFTVESLKIRSDFLSFFLSSSFIYVVCVGCSTLGVRDRKGGNGYIALRV